MWYIIAPPAAAAGQQPPFPVLTIPKASKSCARETETVSGVSLTVGPVSSFSARGSCRTDTHASECSSLTPFWIPDEIKHYFRHRHSEDDDSGGKRDVAQRDNGLKRELPGKDRGNFTRRAGTGWRNPRHALLVVMAVMTGALLTVLLAAAAGEFYIPAPGSPPRAAGVAAPADDSATTHGEAGHGDVLMPTSKHQNKWGIERATSQEVQKTRPNEAAEVADSAAIEDVMRDDVNTTQVYNAGMGGYRKIGVTGLEKSMRNASCDQPAFRFCSVGPAEFYYNATRQACMMLLPDGAGLCNRGQNRFTSLESCQQKCVDGGAPAPQCYEKAVFAECEARDVVDAWWWYQEGKGCRHWRFPQGHCPDGREVFPTSSECIRRCVDAKERESPCVAPKSVVCDVKHLRFGYIADASPRGLKARRCRQLPSAGREAKMQRCLAGANKFPTLEACQRRCAHV